MLIYSPIRYFIIVNPSERIKIMRNMNWGTTGNNKEYKMNNIFHFYFIHSIVWFIIV